jgi:parallel beta-helix repeat protein
VTADKPWGTLLLVEAGADGSRFQHCVFSGGGGALLGRIECKGMVSVHRCRDVEFADCAFRNNLRCDDLLNLVEARAVVARCDFADANGDGLDLDLSQGTIQGCRFRRIANDGIDLMTSAPLIVACTMEECGDKGISIGEDSHPVLFGNRIVQCNRGIEVKDRSEPLIAHNSLVGNQVAVLQSLKNWRYGAGGFGRSYRNELRDNLRDLDSPPPSRWLELDPDPDTARCLLAGRGIVVSASQPGVPAASSWSLVAPRPAATEQRFAEDFESLSDGWDRHGGVTRLEKRDQDLVAAWTHEQGYLDRDVSWSLTAPHRLALQLASRKIASGALAVQSASSQRWLRLPFQLPIDPHRFASVALTLQPGRYSRVRIECVPEDRTGMLWLHELALWPVVP